jgi:endonuclease/exonuclease/phosphatase family metal-dependent hydrolase
VTAADRGGLRVGTWNLASGRLVNGLPASTGQLADAVRSLDVDVLAVQELDRHQPRSGGQDQLALVAEAVGASAARFVPTLGGRPGPGRAWRAITGDDVLDGPSYGIGLVSRYPVLAWRVRRFPASRAVLPMAVPGPRGRPRLLLVPDEPRAAVAAVVDAPGGPVTVISVHLSFAPSVSVRQLRALRRWVRSLPGPVVVAGDLNLPGRLPARLTGWAVLADGATYPAPAPRVQLDHLLLAGLDGAGRTSAPTAVPRAPAPGPRAAVSDHLPLVATLPWWRR